MDQLAGPNVSCNSCHVQLLHEQLAEPVARWYNNLLSIILCDANKQLDAGTRAHRETTIGTACELKKRNELCVALLSLRDACQELWLNVYCVALCNQWILLGAIHPLKINLSESV